MLLLISTNAFMIYYAQEVRAYSLVAFLSVFSTYYFVQFDRYCEVRYLLLNAVFNALLIYTHYVSLVFVAAQYLTLLVFLPYDSN